MDFCREGTSIYNSASMNLEQVLCVIENAEKENKLTVRLHTGDPSIYGAIKEQMDELDKKILNMKLSQGWVLYSSSCSYKKNLLCRR